MTKYRVTWTTPESELVEKYVDEPDQEAAAAHGKPAFDVVVERARFWMGPPPSKCDLTSRFPLSQHDISERFTDGVTSAGPWANMCPRCHARYGRGLGTGRGQEYTKQDDGRWMKTGGYGRDVAR